MEQSLLRPKAMRKHLIERCQRLRIEDVKGVIPSQAASAILTLGTQEVAVIGRITNLHNGHRYCFVCPQCGKAYESLYAADFSLWLCRVCVGAVYASTRKIQVKSEQYEHERSIDPRSPAGAESVR
jgi:ribosomal protein L37AE/L43A